MQEALIFLFKTLADLYLLTFLLRFIMQWARVSQSHYNPLSQFVFRVTNPLVVPARRFLPSVAGLDTPTLIVLILLEIVATLILLRLGGLTLPVPQLLAYSMLRLVALAVWFYTIALLIYVVLSWFGDRSGNPMTIMLGQLVEPVLRPARRLLPPIGGLDLSPLIVTLLLMAIMIALPFPPPLAYLR